MDFLISSFSECKEFLPFPLISFRDPLILLVSDRTDHLSLLYTIQSLERENISFKIYDHDSSFQDDREQRDRYLSVASDFGILMVLVFSASAKKYSITCYEAAGSDSGPFDRYKKTGSVKPEVLTRRDPLDLFTIQNEPQKHSTKISLVEFVRSKLGTTPDRANTLRQSRTSAVSNIPPNRRSASFNQQSKISALSANQDLDIIYVTTKGHSGGKNKWKDEIHKEIEHEIKSHPVFSKLTDFCVVVSEINADLIRQIYSRFDVKDCSKSKGKIDKMLHRSF